MYATADIASAVGCGGRCGEVGIVHPANRERNQRNPEQQKQVGPQHHSVDAFGRVQHVMVVIPEDPDVRKAERVGQKHRDV